MKRLMLIFAVMIGLMGTASGQEFPLMSIHDLQYVPNPDSSNISPYLDDTIRVIGMVATNQREIYIGARWSVFIVDTVSGPWSGIQIVQDDSTVSQTQFGFVENGMIIEVTGIVDEYYEGTQIQIITFPTPIPIEFLDQIPVGEPPIEPTVVDIEDLSTVTTGEQWEETLVMIEGVTMVNNDVGRGAALVQSGAHQIQLEDWRLWIHDCLDTNPPTCAWPANGTFMNVTGWIRHKDEFSVGLPYMIAPWEMSPPWLITLTHPPVIGGHERDPIVPTSSDAVTMKVEIIDNQAVASASVFYSVEGADYVEVVMTETSPDTFSADIPAQADGSLVKYYFYAVDDSDYFSIVPGDTAGSPLFYFVRDGGLMVQDVQYSPFGSGNSGYLGFEVTVQGVVTSTSEQFAYYWIQNGQGPWSGIMVFDTANDPSPGDLVEVTGTVYENFFFTQIADVTAHTVIGTAPLPEPEVLDIEYITTGADSTEAYEAVLIEVHDVVVSNPFPDAPSNFGEFMIYDGTDSMRVDDGEDPRPAFPANGDSAFAEGDSIGIVRGYLFYSYGNNKILPRDTLDIIGHYTPDVSVEKDGVIPEAYSLGQNYPNPFNPKTKFEYSLPVSGEVTLTVFNLLGQRVATLIDGFQEAGGYEATWDGRDSFGIPLATGIYFYRINVNDGKFRKTKKMVLLK